VNPACEQVLTYWDGLIKKKLVSTDFTQVLADRRVAFRLFAPKAYAVQVVFGIKNVPAALSEELKNALKDPNKLNEHLRLFEIVTGDLPLSSNWLP
jgi:hypothetical protein